MGEMAKPKNFKEAKPIGTFSNARCNTKNKNSARFKVTTLGWLDLNSLVLFGHALVVM